MQDENKIDPQKMTTRSYRSRGVNVEISEPKDRSRDVNAEISVPNDRVELKLDGKPIHISVIDGKFHSQLANQFRSFDTVEEVVDTLLANEGRTWTLHGHICGERCRKGEHHHDQGHDGHGHDHGHDHQHGERGGQ